MDDKLKATDPRVRRGRRGGRPWPHRNSADRIQLRQRLLERMPAWDPGDRFLFEPPAGDTEPYQQAVELFTGFTVLPVSMVGPVRVHLGAYELEPARGELQERSRSLDEVIVPLGHTEGGLAASLHRGAVATANDGGITTHVLSDRMTRDCCFVFGSSEEALRFSRWVEAEAPRMRAWLEDPDNPLRRLSVQGVGRLSRHARLWEVDTHVIGGMCHVLYRFTTGDACGPNMITRNSYALNQEYILPRYDGEKPQHIFLEANMGGDKKPSHSYFERGGHGKEVMAEARLSRGTLTRVLHTSARDLLALAHAGVHGALASGMDSFSFTPASAVAAIFATTGQDLGMVGTSSMAHGIIQPAPEDGVSFSLRLPNLEVGTIGGGTGLPYAAAHLRIMGCRGEGSVYRLAQIVAAAALCLEISASAAMATDGSARFYQAHLERGGLRGERPGEVD